MKKIFLLICTIFTILLLPKALYADDYDSILIKTVDCDKAIEAFKTELPHMEGSLARFGFSYDSKIGTPFGKEFIPHKNYLTASYNPEEHIEYYFPILNNGEIVNYIALNFSEKGTVHFSIGPLLSDNLNKLRDGNAYIIVESYDFKEEDSSYGDIFAVSEKKVINLDEYKTEERIPNIADLERSVVDITKPIDIDTSFIIPQTEEEKAIFEDARKNGKTIISQNADELGAINKNSRLLVPFRNIAELMGCTVDWDNTTKAAYAKKNDNIVKFVIGKTEYSVNDKVYNLDVPAEIYNDKTFIPLRAVSESLGASISYNSTTKKITLSY